MINQKVKFTSLKTPLNPQMPKKLLCYDFAFDTTSGRDITSHIFMDTNEELNKRHL